MPKYPEDLGDQLQGIVKRIKNLEKGQTTVTIVGGGGGGGGSYTQTIAVAATTWTIVHNLGYIPEITLYDVGGGEIKGRITSSSITTTVVSFDVAVAGSASAS